MFTFTAPTNALARAFRGLDARRRVQEPSTAETANPGFLKLEHDLAGYLPEAPASARRDEADLYSRLLRDLHDADLAIAEGRFEDAHRMLIAAQDLVFDHYLAVDPDGVDRRHSVDDSCAYLTDRLVDANRTKDRAIIAECRALIKPLTGVLDTARPTPGTAVELAGTQS